MGILSDFFIGDDATATEYDGVSEFPAANRCQLKRITVLEAAGILAVLRGGGDSVELINEFPLMTDEAAETWTFSTPDDLVASLAAIEKTNIAGFAKSCAEETADELGWSQADFEPVLHDLRQLANRAQKDGKKLYLWNSL